MTRLDQSRASEKIWWIIILIIPIPGVYLNDQLKTATNRQQDYLWQEPWELKSQRKYIRMWKLSRHKQIYYFRKLFERKDIQGNEIISVHFPELMLDCWQEFENFVEMITLPL